MAINVRAAVEADLPALTRLDLTYPADRYLAIARSGETPELAFELRWKNRVPARMAVYAQPALEWLREALGRADLFMVAEVEGQPVGYLMIVVPKWTDAAEITDLAVDIAVRRMGAGRALVAAAETWALGRGHRSLRVEPRADNHAAICFYGALGFRLAGFNDRLYTNNDDADGQPTIYMHLELG